MTCIRRALLRLLPTLFVVVALGAALLVAGDAVARVGGGESFSSGSGSGGGSGDGGAADILFLLIWIAIEYPAVGIPLLLLFIGFLVVRFLWSQLKGGKRKVGERRVTRSHGSSRRPGRRSPGLAMLRSEDPGFSVPVLYDFVQLVVHRASAAVGTGAWGPLEPFVSSGARDHLVQLNRNPMAELVVASIQVEDVQRRQGMVWLRVRVATSRLETVENGRTQRFYVEENWHFRRAAGVASLAPEEVRRMGCPSCGSPIDTDTMGRCGSCETPITAGQLQWQANAIDRVERRQVEAPSISRGGGGAEPSVGVPTVRDPDLGAAARAFQARHPEWGREAFRQRVEDVYLSIQRAWSEGRWSDSRPYVTDWMYQSLRFWMERYTAAGLRNKLDDVRLGKVELVKVELDAWYESITVRLWGSMKDHVVDRNGAVVGGNDKIDRNFSEYWTFIRAAGTGADSKAPLRCPSCGAPLDRVSQAGVCGYCDSNITTGRFDWVLSRIEQPEVYGG